MAWRWQCESSGGEAMAPELAEQVFPSQSEAETWLGETWRELRDSGVAAVTLFEEGRKVYGPMSLYED